MDVFNPKILDASIRDVVAEFSANQKGDLLLYAMQSLKYEGRSRTVFENAIQSCLQSHLSPQLLARAHILRGRARLEAGSTLGARDDFQAALEAEPDNPEAKALLHHRSVAVEKLLAPLPPTRGQLSTEIWREIALFLPRQDLKALLFVPHPLSRVASQLLFRRLDLHFSGWHEDEPSWGSARDRLDKDSGNRYAQRSADILTRVITDVSFASVVRSLNVYALKPDKEGSMGFQTGILANALPKLVNLKHVHISAEGEAVVPVLSILQGCAPRLRGLSLQIPDGNFELGTLDFKHLAHLSYETNSGNASTFISQNRSTLRTICLENPVWSFPADILSIRNLTHIHFLGHFPTNNQAIADILTNGRQLESLSLSCFLDCLPSSQFRSLAQSLPFLRHFSFSVYGMNRRLNDHDLFPAICDFLRNRSQLKTLSLTVPDNHIQEAVGFDAAVWGVLPSLANLKGLTMTYPKDLAPGLATWLIPRSVLSLSLDSLNVGRDPASFLNQLRLGVPQNLRFVGLSDFASRNYLAIIEQGFPMARVLRVGSSYMTVLRSKDQHLDLEVWPKRRAQFHANEWLEWLGCEEGQRPDYSELAR
ncbi:hypothetical protein C8J56DRAFT_341215 [Mycena floridula]|nr:hypothetical protein C8J56DRAFT_341215 [Mycena floridula]